MSVGARTDVAVVGAGIIGLSIAWHLGQLGAGSIAVFERTAVGSGASSIQPGGVRQQWASRANCLMARESYTFYAELQDRLSTSIDTTLEPCGYLFVAHTDDALRRLGDAVRLQNEVGIPSKVVSAEEAAAIVPGLAADAIVGGTFCSEDGYFDKPLGVIESFAQAVRRGGALIETVGVRGLARADGCWRLELDDGATVEAGRVVVAAGYDSAALVEPLGLRLPIAKEARFLFYSDPIEERLVEPLIVSGERHFAAKQLADGSVLASDLQASGDPSDYDEVVRWRARIAAQIAELLPILEYVSFTSLVEGFYDLTPDSQPILGPVAGLDGLSLATGFSGRGFMIAPAVGRAVARAVVDGTPVHIPAEFRHGRLELPTDAAELLVV